MCVVKIMRKYDKIMIGRAAGNAAAGNAAAASDVKLRRSGGGGGAGAYEGIAGTTEHVLITNDVLRVVCGYRFAKLETIDNDLQNMDALFAGAFAHGNRALAQVGLLIEQRPPFSWATFDTGVRIGVILVLSIWLLWGMFVDTSFNPTGPIAAVAAAVPMYRGVGCLILAIWLWGVQLFVFSTARVNYMLLFQCDPRTSLSYRDVFRYASSLTIMYLCNVLLVGAGSLCWC